MASERAPQTLQATALVHEAWLRIGGDEQPTWANRSQFFAAAAEAMRRILVDRARRRQAKRHGGDYVRVEGDATEEDLVDRIETGTGDRTIIALHDALERLEEEDPETAILVKLKYFTGLTIAEVGQVMDISKRTAERRLSFARTWLGLEMQHPEDGSGS
jgi:RNA polymerase sigma factor (TIGR02999 family)